MKKLNVALAIFVTAVMAGNAQTNVTVTSDIVGYQTTTLPAGSYKGVGISLVNPAVVTGSIATSASGLLTISGASAIGSTLDAASAYYVEITSGANVGDRFDVNVAATKSANNATVQLDSSSSRNTASSTVNLAGQSLVMRKHVTLDQFRQSLTGTLTGSDVSASQADTAYIHNGNAFDVYYLAADKQTWASDADPEDHRDMIIAPGQGFLFYKRGTQATFTSVGNVRNNNYKQVIPAGYKMCAPGFPRIYTPVSLGGALNQGWNLNDKIYVHSGVAFNVLNLASDGTAQGAWDNGNDPESQNDVQLVGGDTAFLTKLNTASASIETKP